MKICLVHEEYPEETNFGGIATYQKNVAEQLVKNGHQVYVICRGLKENRAYIENGVHVIRVHTEKTDNQIADYELYRERVKNVLIHLQNNNLIDIIEVPDWGAETVLFEPYRVIPLVVRLHTPLKIWLQFNKNDFGPVKDKMLSWEDKMIKEADLITCCSSALKKLIVKDFNIEEEKILVTPNPGNLKDFSCDKTIKKENKLVFVGSLEQRKGVCTLASALNYVFEKYPDLKIDFIGKDTTRNDKNISTIKRIYEIVKPEYHKNINIVGQIPNKDLNKYLNSSLVGIYPSLFDNFPYVVLEAMAAGLHIVGSENSGMVEMLEDPSSIYKTGDEKDLAKKIIEKYELSQKEKYSERNIKRVNELYNSKRVCDDIVKKYEETIYNFYRNKLTKEEIQAIVKLAKIDGEITSFEKEKSGVANEAYCVIINNKKYILKKYNYRYKFDIAKELYNIYEQNNIKVVKPINKNIITYNHYNYNIFEYVENNNQSIDDDFFAKILSIKRETQKEDMLFKKCNTYYEQLKQMCINNESIQEEISFVLDCYNKLKENSRLHGNSINHGDLQRSNILSSQNENYLIDFDESIIASPIYDFAVIAVKMYMDKEINREKIETLIDKIKDNYPNLTKNDYYDMIAIYLCKILLEKYYLYQIKKIDLFSEEQKKDTYVKYDGYLRKILRRN